MVLIWVETQWPGSGFAMAVLGCRSLVLVTYITKYKIIIIHSLNQRGYPLGNTTI